MSTLSTKKRGKTDVLTQMGRRTSVLFILINRTFFLEKPLLSLTYELLINSRKYLKYFKACPVLFFQQPLILALDPVQFHLKILSVFLDHSLQDLACEQG